MKKIIMSCILAVSCGFTFAQEAPQKPVKDDKQQGVKEQLPPPAPPKDEVKQPGQGGPGKQGGRAPGMNQQRGPRARRPGQFSPQILKNIERQIGELIAIYDTNKDGKLDAAEKGVADKELDVKTLQTKLRLARMYEMLKVVDTDGDGVLSEQEKAVAPAKLQEFLKHRMSQNSANRGVKPQKRGGNAHSGGPKAPNADKAK